MLIKITERCSMACKHCMENATKDGNDMDFKTLKDIMNFLEANSLLNFELLISGGEPTEHPYFIDFAKYAFSRLRDANKTQRTALMILTNGLWMLDNPDKVEEIINWGDEDHQIYFQVTNDKRFYPTKVESHKRVFRNKNIFFCDSIEQVYPLGRAVTNNLQWNRKMPYCYNIKAIAKLNPTCQLKDIRQMMITEMSTPHVCNPHIDPYGNIKIGESRLCPVCASVYDDMNTIMEKIRNFGCHECDIIIEKHLSRLCSLYSELIKPILQ